MKKLIFFLASFALLVSCAPKPKVVWTEGVADPETKRKLLEESVPNYTAGEGMPWNEDADLLEWLTSLGKSYDKQ